MSVKRSYGNKFLDAYAMVYALMILLIAAVICSIFLYVNFLHQRRSTHNALQKELNQKVKSAMIYSLSLDDVDNAFISPFNNPLDSIYYHNKPWGILQIGQTQSSRHGMYAQASALIGFQIHNHNTPSLYFPGSKSLQLSGKTRIHELAYVPKRGIERAYINGKNYTGTKLIYGKKKTASSNKPFEALKKYRNFEQAQGLLIPLEAKESIYESDLSYIRAFGDSALVLTVYEDDTYIQNSISGSVILKSESPVRIAGNAQISDALIIAPEISVESGFRGNVQLFAKDSIHIEKDCHLEYPSAAVLIAKSDSASFRLEADSKIEGSVLCYSNQNKRLLYAQVFFDEKSTITGQVLCQNMTIQPQGTIIGSAFFNKLILKTSSSIYENHLMDATFDISKLAPHYSGIPVDTLSGNKRIVKWLF